MLFPSHSEGLSANSQEPLNLRFCSHNRWWDSAGQQLCCRKEKKKCDFSETGSTSVNLSTALPRPSPHQSQSALHPVTLAPQSRREEVKPKPEQAVLSRQLIRGFFPRPRVPSRPFHALPRLQGEDPSSGMRKPRTTGRRASTEDTSCEPIPAKQSWQFGGTGTSLDTQPTGPVQPGQFQRSGVASSNSEAIGVG